MTYQNITKEINGTTAIARLHRQNHTGENDSIAIQLFSFAGTYYVGMSNTKQEDDDLTLSTHTNLIDALESYRVINIGIKN